MKALDTNVLVRFLVNDDERQSKIVYRVFRQAEMDKSTFFVPLLVVLETLWVLESVYNLARNDILDSINEILLMPILKFEAQATIQRFIFVARESKYHSLKQSFPAEVYVIHRQWVNHRYMYLLSNFPAG